MRPLADFLLEQIIDYAIPRRTIEDAYQQIDQTGSMAAASRLHERARRLFTHLANTGEGGELLLFAMAEALFGITQIICKMTLKTSSHMHYHGSDGVYAEARPDGGLNLYWGESKIYADAAGAIRNCLASLAPFLREPEGQHAELEQDILLINECANFSDERLVTALRGFLNRNHPSSLTLKHCGFALCAFDCVAYPEETSERTMDEITESMRELLHSWIEAADRRIGYERLERFDIHFICVPLPSADEFRSYFLSCLGVTDGS